MPRVGLDAYSLLGPTGREICEPDVGVMLRKVKELGGDGLQAGVPPDLGRIREAFELADELGLYLEPYVQLPLHWRNDREVVERRELQLHRVVAVAAERRVRALHCTMGARERFEDVGRWKEYVAQVAKSLIDLGPELRERGIRLGIENHWDFTTYEIREIVDRAGADIVGYGLDTGNLPILAEAPDRAIAHAAPFTVTSHLKDVYLISTPRGAQRPIVPLGQGQTGMAETIRLLYRHNPELNFTIEDHPVVYDVDYFEDWWLAAVPELTTHDIATTARLAREGDHWLSDHLVADPHAAELIPWSIRGPGRLRADILYVKKILSEVTGSQ